MMHIENIFHHIVFDFLYKKRKIKFNKYGQTFRCNVSVIMYIYRQKMHCEDTSTAIGACTKWMLLKVIEQFEVELTLKS